MYTGHVTAGGSICLEALTLSGTSGSWQPDFTVESLLNVIVINMVGLFLHTQPLCILAHTALHCVVKQHHLHDSGPSTCWPPIVL
jgi:ubiquitin-protein ligase